MLLDTSGLLSYHCSDEAMHQAAKRLFKARRRQLTHGYILAEFLALVNARRLPRSPALRFARTLLEHPRIEIVWVDEPLHRAALQLLEARPDKMYSLCDAVSFVLMRRRGITEALTTDHHFAQEGFRRLLA